MNPDSFETLEWDDTVPEPSLLVPHRSPQRPPLGTNLLGQTIGGRYQIVRHLGGGGFSRTFLAADQHLPGKPYCVVKQLKPKVIDDDALQAARRLFDREAEVLYALGNHDQIPRLFAHFEEAAEFYLVQEFVDGKLLRQEMKEQKRLTEEEVILLLQDILATLQFVHEQQVIHRDIKPSNLIRRESDRRIVLIDFGAVRQISLPVEDPSEMQDNNTTLTIAIGSAGYMPNEQLAGKPRFSSDVYAVGMVGIQALTGRLPSQLPEDVRTGEVLWRDRTHLSPELSTVLETMVRYDFRQRYQTAAEALEAVQSLMSGVVLPLPATASIPDPANDGHLAWTERGDDLFQQQRYQEAVDCFDRVLQATPTDELLWFKRGLALEYLKRYDEALESYDRVIQIQPTDYLAWFKRAKLLELLQRYEEAIAAFDQVLQVQPKNYWSWHDRGKVLERAERYEEAAESYDRAVQIKPDFTLAIESRRNILSRLRQVDQLYSLEHYEETIASCETAIRVNPEDPLAWLRRGMVLEKMQQWEEAIASYTRVIELQPDDHLAWFKRGSLMERLERYNEAGQSYTRVLKLQPQNYWAWHDRARVLEILHKYEAALTSYDRAVQIKPDFQAAIDGRQRVLVYLRQAQTAAQSHQFLHYIKSKRNIP